MTTDTTSCTRCGCDLPGQLAYTCNNCYYPFCERCYKFHYQLGYHHDGTWTNDHIIRPNTTHHQWAYMPSGSGGWLPHQDPESWGTWYPEPGYTYNRGATL